MRLSSRKPSLAFFLTAGLASFATGAGASPGALAHQHASLIGAIESPASPQVEFVKQAGKMHRVIVQYGQRKSAAQERRILRALKGLPFEVVTRFQYSPSIVLKVDRRGLERLRAMPGVTIQFDEPVPPT